MNYNNAENLKRVEGHTAIVHGTQDIVIPKRQTEKLIESTPDTDKTHAVIEADVTHTGAWTEHASSVEAFNEFLEKAHLRRKVF